MAKQSISGLREAILLTGYRSLAKLQTRFAPLAGGLTSGVGIIVISLWFWREAAVVADEAGAAHPRLAIYSIRFAAVAGITISQVLLLNFVVGRMYRPTVFDEVIKRAAGLIFAVSLAAAVAFALLAK
jgi:hypothetical protein